MAAPPNGNSLIKLMLNGNATLGGKPEDSDDLDSDNSDVIEEENGESSLSEHGVETTLAAAAVERL